MTPDLIAWMDRAATDGLLAWHCRGLSLTLCLRSPDGRTGLRLCEKPARITGEALDAADILVVGTDAAFALIARPDPPPGYHSFGALLRHNTGIEISADALAQAQALAALERLVELARPAPPPFAGFGFAHDAGTVLGRRREMRTPGGRTALIHWIEAGEGPPIVFMHTAGADSRQFLHQLADIELRHRHRLIAFDMPWHGLSSGEDGQEATAGYKLTEEAYLDWCRTVIEDIACSEVVLAGCSMGAAIALTLTASRPDLVRGCIALEAPMSAPGRRSDLLTDARIADGQHNPAYVRAMLGPACPQKQRDEACAIYAQARPGIYMGDLAYYSDEYDGARIADGLREANRPVALLTGSYDYSASPENTRRLHEAVASKRIIFREMPGLGHFPMIEDPGAFRPHLLGALAHIGDDIP